MPWGVAPQVDGHLHLHAIGLADPQQIDMDRLDTEGVPLEFTNQSALLDGAGEIHHAAAVTDDGFQGLPLGGEIDAFFTVAIQNRRHHALATEAAALPGSSTRPRHNFEGIAHENSLFRAQ